MTNSNNPNPGVTSWRDVYAVHPCADCFPMLPDAEINEMAADIEKHGLRQRVVMWRDATDDRNFILDGRNRLEALSRLGVNFGSGARDVVYPDGHGDTIFESYFGDPAAYVISANIHRRHLTKEQQAELIVRTLEAGQQNDRAKVARSFNPTDGQRGGSTKDPLLTIAVEEGKKHGISKRTIQTARATVAGRTPTPKPLAVHFSSESAEHYTPRETLDAVIDCLGAIDLDPCSNEGTPNVPAARHFTKAGDGLARPWSGRVFMNPPYGREIGAWIQKARHEWQRGDVTALIALLPARTDTEWFEDLTRETDDLVICFLRGRLTFIGNDDPAPFPSMVAYLGARDDVFERVFGELGTLMSTIGARGMVHRSRGVEVVAAAASA